ncbi:MAG: signal peptide peptidase SppA [Bacteroidales bacterium]
MNSFIKSIFSTVIGVGLATLIIFVIFASILGGILSSSQQGVKVQNNSVLVLSLNQPIVDRVVNNPFNTFSSITSKQQATIGLNDILRSINTAQNDDRIKGILLTDMEYTMSGLATIEEIRNALIDFKNAGKFIVSYSDIYGQKPYYLASIADNIYMNAIGSVDLRGLSTSIMFFKGTLEKLEIEPQIIRHGQFKSAVEPFMYDKMSIANRTQIKTYTESIWQHIVKGISLARQIPIQRINNIAEHLELRDSKTAVELKIVDALKHRDEVLSELATLTQQEGKSPTLITIKNYSQSIESYKTVPLDKVAIVYAIGEIMATGTSERFIGEELATTLRKARLDSTVKSVVLRINSPGGSAITSEIIYREVALTAAVKPLVVSMGDVVASGGYYIACPASYIFASPTTITGSIGVFGVLFNAKKLLKNKIGITVDVENTNQYADMGNITRPLSEGERNYFQSQIEQIYKIFIHHVESGRYITKEQVEKIAEGRVWSGVDAKNIKLIDDFGGLNAAIDKAVLLANLEQYQIVELPIQKNTFELLLEGFEQVAIKIMQNPMDNLLQNYPPFTEIIKMHRTIQTRIPYNITID